MNAEQKQLVRESFAEVVPIADAAARLFYGRLFELDPDARALFTNDMEEQGRKLMQMLKVAVNGLDRLDTLLPALKALGARHVDYGVKPEQYPTVGAALLWTLQQGLGDKFTPEVKDAWTEVYTLMANAMLPPTPHPETI